MVSLKSVNGSSRMIGWNVLYPFQIGCSLTGIMTYVWIVTNKKSPDRKGNVQLIDGTSFNPMKKNLGDKVNTSLKNRSKDCLRYIRTMKKMSSVRSTQIVSLVTPRLLLSNP